MEEVRRQKGPPPKRRERGNKIGRERDLMEIIRTKQEIRRERNMRWGRTEDRSTTQEEREGSREAIRNKT